MKLLFDQNLSSDLRERLQDLFPGSCHVMDPDVGLRDADDKTDDSEIWEYAKRRAFAIASTDSDFLRLSCKNGFPPKVILMPGNCTLEGIERILRERYDDLLAFYKNEQGVLDLR